MKPYEDCKVFGPYRRKDSRFHVVIQHSNRRLQTVSFPKFWMEQKLGRYLNRNEEVHHIDENHLNNHPSNFELKNSTEHRRHHQTKYKNDIIVRCFECKKSFILTVVKQRKRAQNKYKNSAGPFCSKRCVGVYGARIQNQKGIFD